MAFVLGIVWGFLLSSQENRDSDHVDGDRWATACFVVFGLCLLLAGFLFGWTERHSRRGFEVIRREVTEAKDDDPG